MLATRKDQKLAMPLPGGKGGFGVMEYGTDIVLWIGLMQVFGFGDPRASQKDVLICFPQAWTLRQFSS